MGSYKNVQKLIDSLNFIDSLRKLTSWGDKKLCKLSPEVSFNGQRSG